MTERWEERRDSGGVVYRNNSGCATSKVEVEIMVCSGWRLRVLCSRKISYKIICFPWRSTKVRIATGIRNMLASFPRVLANKVHFSPSHSFPEPCSMAHNDQRNEQKDFEVSEPALS